MTKEQFIIYLYGIYPQGGISIILTIITAIATILMALIWLEDEKEDFKKVKNKYITLLIIWIFTLTIGYLIPTKNTFLAIVATPTLIKSLEEKDGKLFKVDKLLNQALNKAEEILKEK